MMDWVHRWQLPPIVLDEDRTRITRLLNVMLLIMLASAVIYAAMLPFIQPNDGWQLLLILIVIPFLLLLLAMTKRGQLWAASLLLIAGMWLIVSVSMLLSGGLYSSSASIYLVFIIAAALLLGGRYGIAVAALSVVASTFFLWAGNSNLLTQRIVMSPAAFWLAQILTFGMAAVLLYLDTKSMEKTADRAREHQLALTEQNRELQVYTERLEQRETALAATEERYRVVSELISDYAYAIEVTADNELRLIWVTDAFERISGYKSSELPSADDWFHMIVEEDRPKVQAWIAASQRGEEHTHDYRLRAKDGELHWLRNYSRPIQDKTSDGTVLICGAVQDITGQKVGESEQAKLLLEISRQREELRALNRRLADVQEMERQHLVRELHDQIGQNLTAIALSLNLIKGQIAGEENTDADSSKNDMVVARLNDTISLVRETTVQTRDVMADLRPPVLDDYGLIASLEWYAERIHERTGLIVKVNCDRSLPRLDTSTENALFRITQEAMTNIVKHAEATCATVVLSGQHHAVLLAIGDDGCGIAAQPFESPTERSGWGLLTMQQRAESIGGTFCLDSYRGQGTVVIVEAPL